MPQLKAQLDLKISKEDLIAAKVIEHRRILEKELRTLEAEYKRLNREYTTAVSTLTGAFSKAASDEHKPVLKTLEDFLGLSFQIEGITRHAQPRAEYEGIETIIGLLKGKTELDRIRVVWSHGSKYTSCVALPIHFDLSQFNEILTTVLTCSANITAFRKKSAERLNTLYMALCHSHNSRTDEYWRNYKDKVFMEVMGKLMPELPEDLKNIQSLPAAEEIEKIVT